MRNQKSMMFLRPGPASTSPAKKTPESIFVGKTPPQTKKSFPQAWGLIPQTSPTFPQTWGFSADTWGIIGEAWGRGVGAGPAFPHVLKLGVVSRKHPGDPWGNGGETWGSFPQVWGNIPQVSGTSAGGWNSSFETGGARGARGLGPAPCWRGEKCERVRGWEWLGGFVRVSPV